MEFPSRKLKSYAEPIEVDALRIGEIYFAVSFLDEKMLIPALEPLVFIGRNLSSGDADKVYFQDAESYLEGLRFSREATEQGARFITGSTTNIFAYERALDLLLSCSIRRAGSAP